MTTDSTVVVNDLPTRVLTAGADAAPTVVFLHDGGWGGSADVTWGSVIPLAAQEYRVVAPDLLGFGGSAKSVRLDESPFGFRLRHVFALLDQLEVADPVHLVGNSFGGSLGLRALTDPTLRDRVASVTTISGTGGPWRTPKGAELGPFDGTETDMARIVDLLIGDDPLVAEQVAARMVWARMPGHYASNMAVHLPIPDALKVQRPADPFPANLDGLETPVLLFECVLDPLVEVGWTSNLTGLLPQAKVVEVQERHCPNITAPEQTWAEISAFLSATGAGA